MNPFTRELRHPSDPTRAKWETVQRWQRDDKRFPVDAYSESNLLWRGDEWRTPTSTERAHAHGCPPAAVKRSYADKLKGTEAEKMANSAIGNGFHITSAMIIFIMLLQSATAWPMPYNGIRRPSS